MSLITGKLELQEQQKKLNMQWKQLQSQWQDSRAREFEREFVTPLQRQSKNCLEAVQSLEDLLQQIKKDLES